jgi:hypothetical protein
VGRRATFVAAVLLVDFASAIARRVASPDPAGGGGRRDGRPIDSSGSRAGRRSSALLAKGQRLLVTGEVRRYRFAKELLHPEIERIDAAEGGRRAARGAAPDRAATTSRRRA